METRTHRIPNTRDQKAVSLATLDDAAFVHVTQGRVHPAPSRVLLTLGADPGTWALHSGTTSLASEQTTMFPGVLFVINASPGKGTRLHSYNLQSLLQSGFASPHFDQLAASIQQEAWAQLETHAHTVNSPTGSAEFNAMIFLALPSSDY